MRPWHLLASRLRALFRKEQLDLELDDQLQFHLEMQIRENLDAGMKPDEARFAAFRSLGGVDRVKETCRDQRGINWIENLLQDTRFGLRMLAKHPGSTALAVLILAVGIGGNTAVFSVVDKTILHPIPGKATDQLVALQEIDVVHNAQWNVSPPLFAELSTYTNVFASLAAYFQSPATLTLERNGTTVKLSGATTTPGFFRLLGVRPLAGRAFLPEEGKSGNDNVLVASYGMWQYFGGDSKFVGSPITLSGRAYTVVGVMPPAFQFPFSPEESQFFIPHVFTAEETTNPDQIRNRTWAVIGRLQDGVSLSQARALLDTLAQRRQKEHPEPNSKWVIEAKPAQTMFVGPTLAPTLWSLQAAVAMLLLISCANVGTLLLARAVARRGEFSIRMAIGAGRSRLIRQLIAENLLLAGLAGLIGLFFAWGGIRALDRFYLGSLPRMRAVGLDGWVLTLTLLVSGLAGMVFGVAPAGIASHLNLTDALKDTAQQQSGGFVARLFQDGLVVLQVSLAVVLLVGAGLMLQTTAKLLRVDPGLDPKGLYRVIYDANPLMKTVQPDYEAVKQGGAARRQAIAEWFAKEVKTELQWDETMVKRLCSIPGIEAAAINGNSGGAWAYGDFHVEGRDDLVQLSPSQIGIRSGDYFRTLRLPLLAGRLLTTEDCVAGQQAVVVNQELARRCWPGQDPLGKRLSSADQFKEEYVVGGVVKGMLDWRRDTPQQPTLYVPVERLTKYSVTRGSFIIRSKLQPTALREVVKRLGMEMVPATQLNFFDSVETGLYASTAPRRVYMWLLTTMGILGLLLSALGVYAVMAYAVVRRTREIGIRMAMGATRGNIARLIVGRGGRLVINGMVLGTAAAFTLAHYVESLLYQVKPTDPWVFGGVFLTLGTVAAVACYLPARRAMRIDPMTALRCE
ncbi:MAG: ADOP family duplicated permease [Limisphaerales bacterium]